MTAEEKNIWVYGVVAIGAYAAYLVLLLATSDGGSLASTPYVVPLLSTVGAAIVAGIVSGIVIGMGPGGRQGHKDERDREIYRFGERLGHVLVIGGAAAALILALVRADQFWIANVIYLAFVLSAVVSTVAKLVAYRRGLPQW